MEDNKMPLNENNEDESIMDVLKRIETKVDANDNSKLNSGIEDIIITGKEKRIMLEAIEKGDPQYSNITDLSLSNEDGPLVQQYLYSRMQQATIYTNTFKMWRVIIATVCVVLLSLIFIGFFPVVLYYSTPFLITVKNYSLLSELYIFGLIMFCLVIYKIFYMIRNRTTTKQIKFFHYISVKVHDPLKKGFLYVESRISIFNILQIIFGFCFWLVILIVNFSVAPEFKDMSVFANTYMLAFTFLVIPFTNLALLIDMKILSVTFKTKNLKIVAWHNKYIIYFVNNLKNVK